VKGRRLRLFLCGVMLTVMNDSGDTGESSVSYVDYIEVYR
jgi:hypothetical protein